MNLEELSPLLFQQYRKLSKETGPLDRLQTREFKAIAQKLKNHEPDLYTYLLYYMPLRYQEGLSLIGECPKPPARVLDLFARVGPFSLAALEKGAGEVIMMDKDRTFLDAGAQVIGRMGYPVTTKVWDPSKPLRLDEPFDLIIAAYPDEPLKDEFVERLIDKLTPEGVLLLVDSSLPGPNKAFLERRDRFVKKRYPVQAPCVFQGECVALKSGAPCYAQRPLHKIPIIKDLQRSAGINLSSLKMSYLMIRPKQAGWPQVPPSARVISPPIETHEGEKFFLCATDGKKLLGSTLKTHPKASRAY
ncbi:MAG: class I SAM-dependent methyltransferase, partial [Chlamydiia bacterium]|nr:class I SAM-dependent methyltransferase [Chlamydiia bacterium]